MDAAIYGLLHSPSARLRRAYRALHRAADAALADFGANADQLALMRLVSLAGGVTQRELADLLASDPNTVAAMAARLEKQGLIRRTPHKRNARARSVYLTAAGRRRLATLIRPMQPLYAALDACFRGKDGEKVLAALDRVYRAATDINT